MIHDKPGQGKDIAKSIRISERMNEEIRDHIRSLPRVQSFSEFFRYAAAFAMREADPALLTELNDINWHLNRLAGVVVRFEASREHIEPAHTNSVFRELVELTKRTKRLLERIEDTNK